MLASLLIYSEKATSPQVGTITKEDRNHSYTHQGRSYKYDLTTAENSNVDLSQNVRNCWSKLLRFAQVKW
ncbi:hypothetical protein GCM10011538_09070 [Ligilactobacillus murinus]